MGVYGLWMRTWGDPRAAIAKVKPVREHKLTPRDIVSRQIESVERGGAIVYELGAIYIKPFITIVKNASYPVQGKEYTVFQEGRADDGAPSGKRGRFWDTNKSSDIARWLLEREGRLFRAPIRTGATT
jgi:hypothetical protein